ncbi:MAG: DUF3052 domain-containing protein [Acidobacteria bacterium]|nr:DUF3052 domain-containing protein [Acidobacteriota bacterium]
MTKKLGIREASRVLVANAPRSYTEIASPLPPGVELVTRATASVDLAHLFVTRRSELERRLTTLRARLRPEVPVWVSWPKKSSKVPTDVTEEVVRAVALPMGWVDVKVCAVDALWSGLKLVVRKTLR